MSITPNRKDFIHEITDNSAFSKEKIDKTIKYYSSNGSLLKKKFEITDVCCKEGNGEFFIRVNLRNQCYEPHSTESLERDRKLAKSQNYPVNLGYKFLKVNKECFDNYMQYLNHRSYSRIQICQSMIDGENQQIKTAFVMTKGLSALTDEEKGFIHPI